jgi:hypothetical protein
MLGMHSQKLRGCGFAGITEPLMIHNFCPHRAVTLASDGELATQFGAAIL